MIVAPRTALAFAAAGAWLAAWVAIGTPAARDVVQPPAAPQAACGGCDDFGALGIRYVARIEYVDGCRIESNKKNLPIEVECLDAEAWERYFDRLAVH